jgi:hypothetical protein
MRNRDDNREFNAFARRIVNRHARRIAEQDDIEGLSALAELGRQVDELMRDTVHQLREQDRSWAEVGDVLGITRQAACQRFGGNGTRRVGGQPAHLR